MNLGGWAATPEARRALLSYWPYLTDDPEPVYAIADAWEPPHDLALPVETCDRFLALAGTIQGSQSGNGTYYMPDLPADLRKEVIGRFEEANRIWWRLELNEWWIGLKRYQPGEAHPEHQDLHAGAARRKFAGVVQLSNPDTYAGGDLVMRFADHNVPMPRTRGTLVAFPGWTNHQVTPITSGTRWSLCVNGWGPPLR